MGAVYIFINLHNIVFQGGMDSTAPRRSAFIRTFWEKLSNEWRQLVLACMCGGSSETFVYCLFQYLYPIHYTWEVKHTRVVHKPKAFNSFSDGCNKCYEFLRIFMV